LVRSAGPVRRHVTVGRFGAVTISQPRKLTIHNIIPSYKNVGHFASANTIEYYASRHNIIVTPLMSRRSTLSPLIVTGHEERARTPLLHHFPQLLHANTLLIAVNNTSSRRILPPLSAVNDTVADTPPNYRYHWPPRPSICFDRRPMSHNNNIRYATVTHNVTEYIVTPHHVSIRQYVITNMDETIRQYYHYGCHVSFWLIFALPHAFAYHGA